MVNSIRQDYNIKLPDSIIIAALINLEMPLISADKEFSKVEELYFLFYDNN